MRHDGKYFLETKLLISRICQDILSTEVDKGLLNG